MIRRELKKVTTKRPPMRMLMASQVMLAVRLNWRRHGLFKLIWRRRQLPRLTGRPILRLLRELFRLVMAAQARRTWTMSPSGPRRKSIRRYRPVQSERYSKRLWATMMPFVSLLVVVRTRDMQKSRQLTTVQNRFTSASTAMLRPTDL